MLHNPHATNIQWIHSIGSLPCGKAAGTLSCEKYTVTPSFSPGTGVYKNVHQITFYASLALMCINLKIHLAFTSLAFHPN